MMKRYQTVKRYLLRFPIFYKILIANSSLIVLWALGCILFFSHIGNPIQWGIAAFILISGVGICVFINMTLIRLALSPLDSLCESMNQISKGNFEVCALPHPLAEARMASCFKALNQMMDVLRGERERSELLAKQIISAQEGERKRIAGELHDETSQILATLSIGLEKLKLDMPESAPNCAKCRSDVYRLKGLTDKALIELHRLTFNLRPSLLDDMGLKPAVSSLLREQLEKAGIQVEFDWKGEETRIPEESEISIFRIIQEAVTNIIKYAHASEVTLTITQTPDQIDLNLRDNGIGFNPSNVKLDPMTRFGIYGMKERILLLNGKFNLQSEPGKGTLITASIPIQKMGQPLLQKAKEPAYD